MELPERGVGGVGMGPPAIITALGGADSFSLDPCAAPNPRPWATALHHITEPDNGLGVEWNGRVWMNPPYGAQTAEWMERLAAHKNGTALIFARTETECWHQQVWPKASAILFLAGRLFFHHHDGRRAKHNAGAPSALVAYGLPDALVLRNSGIAGFYVDLSARASER
jgi:hypothetical protein